MTISGRMGKISVFCSYAREDESFRRRLEEHLAPLRDEKIIDDWYDERVQPGARWNDQIGAALNRARLVLFLVSPDLLASTYVRDVELPRSLELERANRCQIVPIIVRQAEWEGSRLAEFQALPRSAKPVESYSNAAVAYAEIIAGLREVCKRIVDWENPYKRTEVGDWTHYEQTMTVPDGRSLTAEGTAEVIEKNHKQAVVAMEIWGNGEHRKQNINIDLTKALEDIGSMMNQVGEPLPENVEVRTGPARYEEEIVNIGSKRYETIKGTREFAFAQRGWEQRGFVSTWRCIDVPCDGIVKGTSEMPAMRQNMVLLGYGHRDAASRKPRPGHTAQAVPVFGPGRWLVQMNAFGVTTAIDLFLHPNGALQGSQAMMGMAIPLQGTWGFDPSTNVIRLQLVASMMGMPAAQDFIQMQITGLNGAFLQAADALGRQFVLQRAG